jgi:hypothetical protein
VSASQQSAQQATAMQIAVALRSYERHIRALVPSRLDVDLYQAASLEIDQLRAWCGTIPATSVPWIGLLISHAELMHALWTHKQHPDGGDEEIQQRLDEHIGRIQALARRCENLAAAPAGASTPWR